MLQPTDPLGDIIGAFYAFVYFLQLNFFPILFLILIWIILLILSSIITRLVRRRAKTLGVPPNAINGINLAIRIIFIWIAVIAITAFLPLHIQVWVVSIVGDAAVIIGLAVGIAISLAIRNFVAGLYVMVTNPFNVGDYVRIGSNEGIVLEISLNYTKIRQMDGTTALIPNDNVMSSSVTNFRFEQKRLLETDQKQEPHEDVSIPNRIWKVLSQAVDTSTLIQYAFELQFPIAPGLNHYEEKLRPVMKRWTRKFGYKPDFVLSSTSNFAFTYTFTIFVENPKLLLDSRFDFLEDITRAVY
ncbi:MAG: mechanosensitive ion channel family protein [Promethearchaeota archaeon]